MRDWVNVDKITVALFRLAQLLSGSDWVEEAAAGGLDLAAYLPITAGMLRVTAPIRSIGDVIRMCPSSYDC